MKKLLFTRIFLTRKIAGYHQVYVTSLLSIGLPFNHRACRTR